MEKTHNTNETTLELIPADSWKQAMNERATGILERMGREPTPEAIEEIKADCLVAGFDYQEELLERAGR